MGGTEKVILLLSFSWVGRIGLINHLKLFGTDSSVTLGFMMATST
jgi:hypothetical protein